MCVIFLVKCIFVLQFACHRIGPLQAVDSTNNLFIASRVIARKRFLIVRSRHNLHIIGAINAIARLLVPGSARQAQAGLAPAMRNA